MLLNSAEGPVMDRCERMSIRYRGGYSFSFKRPKYFGSACQVVTVVIALRNVAMNGYFCLGTRQVLNVVTLVDLTTYHDSVLELSLRHMPT
ncbi:hypothetical protein RRG08_030418 [Elysia crispata]|uniref:Uncharacterized protein n=1 Tax=Elysia crispata TaxID=231223 RepID=A0AAE1CYN4_9GAST|nr:hypothetical protein RRG08_030418 [Elysia crispata]